MFPTAISAAMSFVAFFSLYAVTEVRAKKASLRCCVVFGAPFVFSSDMRNPPFEGLSIDYLNHLQDLTEHQCDSLEPFNSSVSKEGTVVWNDFIDDLVRCTGENGQIIERSDCKCDIGVGAWFENDQRLDVDFLPAFAYDDHRVLINAKDATNSSASSFFLTAFSSIVWVCITILALVFVFLKMLDKRFAPPDSSYVPLPDSESNFKRIRHFLLKSNLPFRLRRAVQSTFSQMIGQNSKTITGDNSSTRQWILNFCIALCGIFLILVYEATMTASLVQEKVLSDFRSVHDFKSCRIKDSDVCFVQGDANEAFWNNSIANQGCRKPRGDVETLKNVERPSVENTYDAILEKVASGKCKFLLTDGATAAEAVHGKYCNKLLIAGEPFFRGGLSFVLPKDSPYFEPMRKATLQLQEQDALETIQKYYKKKGRSDSSTVPQLTYRKLRIFFIIAFSVCVVLFLEMILDPQTPLQPISNNNVSAKESEASCTDGNSSADSVSQIP